MQFFFAPPIFCFGMLHILLTPLFLTLLFFICIVLVIWLIKGRKNARHAIPDATQQSIAGFAYDEIQDIFYSTKDAWQRTFGYCQAYDEAAAPASMIIDCEPLRFEYEGKRWLIELWKGQYGVTTGCEIGVYTSDGTVLSLPKGFDATFYGQTLDEDHLQMECALFKNSQYLFSRSDCQWWLTGFVLGEFTNPRELSMQVKIQLKTKEMRDIFVDTLKKSGYVESDLLIDDNDVIFIFDKPHAPQPLTQKGFLANFTQEKNKLFCRLVSHMTKDLENSLDKFNYLQKKAPFVAHMMGLTGGKKMYRAFKKMNRRR